MLSKDHIAAITRAAICWSRHARDVGCRFAVEEKAAEATAFAISRGGRSFALPSKLEGTAATQDTLLHIRDAMHADGWQALTLAQDDRHLLALWRGAVVGRVRPKHLRWLVPLLQTGFVRCYVLTITGGDPGPAGATKTLGCNIVYTGLDLALDALARQTRRDVKRTYKDVLGTPALNGRRKVAEPPGRYAPQRPPVYRSPPPPSLVCERDAKGRFLPGPDPDRHTFTPEECRAGFRAAVASIIERYPTAFRTDEETGHTYHIAREFLSRKYPDQYEAIVEQGILDRFRDSCAQRQGRDATHPHA